MEVETVTNSAGQTKKLAAIFAKKLKAGDIVCLFGDLGTGKTTFVQGLAKGLGVGERIKSPTFLRMKIYQTKRGFNFCHIDLYQIDSSKDLPNLGFEDFLGDPQTISVVEWAEKIEKVLPKRKVIKVSLEIIDKNKRKIILNENLRD